MATNQTPSELICQILRHISENPTSIEDHIRRQSQLYQLSLVNRQWHSPAVAYLWHSLVMRSDRAIERSMSADIPLDQFLFVRELVFTRETDPRVASQLINRCTSLRRLQFNWHIGQAECKHLRQTIVPKLNKLQHLCLNGCYFMCNPFELIADIATQSRRTIESITFEASEINFRFTPNNQPLAEATCVLERLHTLKITDNTGFTDSSLISLLAVPQMLPNLENLDLNGSRSLTDWSLPLVLRNFPQLKRIYLTNTLVSVNTMQTIADHCAEKIEELVIGTREQPYKSSQSDFHWYSFMRIPAASVVRLSEKCSNLRILHLNGCDELDDDAVARVLLALPCLEALDVGRSAITMHLFRDMVTDANDELKSRLLLQRLCQLRYLGLSGCANLHLAQSQGRRSMLGPFERLILTDFNCLERLDCSQLPGIQTKLLYRYRSCESLPESIKYLSPQYAGLYEMTACVLDGKALVSFRDAAAQISLN